MTSLLMTLSRMEEKRMARVKACESSAPRFIAIWWEVKRRARLRTEVTTDMIWVTEWSSHIPGKNLVWFLHVFVRFPTRVGRSKYSCMVGWKELSSPTSDTLEVWYRTSDASFLLSKRTFFCPREREHLQ